MEIKVGSDILQLKKFKRSFQKYPQKFKRDIFCESELKNPEISHLAGIFSAKEAVIKALDFPAGKWKQIEIGNLKSGKPFLKLQPKLNQKSIKSCDLSISHHGDYIIAVAVFILK
ncbi:holo-ACP synthase [Patescibacteria group bacterium]|nr:holo-ACP synthase [Patescibacteria group bacterium]